jgi:hypothetical protein
VTFQNRAGAAWTHKGALQRDLKAVPSIYGP